MAFFGRGKNKITNIISYKEIYKSYIESVGKDNELYAVPKDVFNNVIKDYYKELAETVLGGSDVRLPAGIGPLGIRKKKLANSLPIDWKASAEHKKLVFLFNEHSDGYKPFFLWGLDKAKVIYINYYRFKPCRSLARTLAAKIKNERQDYFQK